MLYHSSVNSSSVLLLIFLGLLQNHLDACDAQTRASLSKQWSADPKLLGGARDTSVCSPFVITPFPSQIEKRGRRPSLCRWLLLAKTRKKREKRVMPKTEIFMHRSYVTSHFFYPLPTSEHHLIEPSVKPDTQEQNSKEQKGSKSSPGSDSNLSFLAVTPDPLCSVKKR
ncbi:hypothetical protein V8C42DRAFT_120721 [Trichoderma barbatum]